MLRQDTLGLMHKLVKMVEMDRHVAAIKYQKAELINLVVDWVITLVEEQEALATLVMAAHTTTTEIICCRGVVSHIKTVTAVDAHRILVVVVDGVEAEMVVQQAGEFVIVVGLLYM